MAQRKFIIDGGFQVNDDSIIIANLEMTGNILPTVDSDGTTGYDLGSPTAKWRDLYLSSGSLYIDGQKVMESDAGTIVVQADPDQSLTTKTTGTGVITLQSPNPLLMAATLQMQSGKKITDASGTAVVFGDKIDADSNQIINVGAPTADAHAATKLYVDSLFGTIDQTAISTGDTEVGIADLGTGTVGITVDGTQRFALTATGLAMTVPVTVNGVQLANVTEVAAAETAANAYTDTRETAITTAYESYADTAVANLVDAAPGTLDTLNELAAALGDDPNFSTTVTNTLATKAAITYVDAQDSALDVRLTTAEGDIATNASDIATNATAIATNSSNLTAEISARQTADTAIETDVTNKIGDATVDGTAGNTITARIATALSSAQSYADTAESDAVTTASADATSKANTAEANANTYTDTRETAITTAYQTYADTAESDAVTTANAYTDTRETAITSAYQSYADTAEADAISTAAADATSKVNAEASTRAAADTALDTAKAEKSVNMIAGSGLTGGGTLASNRTFNVGAGTGISVAADTVSVDTTWADARYVNPADLAHFHSAVQTITSAQSTTNVSATVALTFSDLTNAKHYAVYLNRQLLRPTAEYTVSGSTVTFAVGVLTTDDEIEVSGLKLS
jgi:hypothetical protein